MHIQVVMSVSGIGCDLNVGQLFVHLYRIIVSKNSIFILPACMYKHIKQYLQTDSILLFYLPLRITIFGTSESLEHMSDSPAFPTKVCFFN